MEESSSQAKGNTLISHETFSLDIPLRGNRDYLHSTDIFASLTELARQNIDLNAWVDSLVFRRPLRKCMCASFQFQDRASGTFRLRCGSLTVPGWLVEADKLILRRVAYDCGPLSAVMISNARSFRLTDPVPGFTAIEVIVNMMQKLAYKKMPGHWWLCELSLQRPLTSEYPIEVSTSREVGQQCLLFEIVQRNITIGTSRLMRDTEGR